MRALISVYDKQGLVDFALSLVELGWSIVSSGGTSAALADAGVAHEEVESVTGAPEMLGGRVKTLHPRIHGGILADRSVESHLADLSTHGINPIDLVVVNLYPFESNPSIELIDVGGPTMVRAAAKNHAHVGVVTSPDQYESVLHELRTIGALSSATRRSLALRAFERTATYDAAIASWLAEEAPDAPELPERMALQLQRADVLRYGENPHQLGARYRFRGAQSWWDQAMQHGGKEMSYLNVFDADAAWRLVHDLGTAPAVAIIKHATPCGAAVGSTIADAYRRAFDCDSTSAFGGVIALNSVVDEQTALAIAEVFTEVVVAPGFSDDALRVLSAKANLRTLSAPPPAGGRLDFRSVDGGLLVQTADDLDESPGQWRVASARQPTADELAEAAFAWRVCAHVKSNAIVLSAPGRQAVGIGAGQQSRVDAAEIAARKAAGRAAGGVCASDAFFPFPDAMLVAADAGVAVIVQPGGSVRDDEVIAAANERGLVMLLTGRRHFRH